MRSNLEIVKTYFRCVDSEDLETLNSLFATDAVLLAAGAGERRDERIMSFYRNVFKKFPEHKDIPTRFLEVNDSIVVEIRFNGRSATGVSVEFPAVDVFDLRNGKIIRLSQWVDTAALERKLQQ